MNVKKVQDCFVTALPVFLLEESVAFVFEQNLFHGNPIRAHSGHYLIGFGL